MTQEPWTLVAGPSLSPSCQAAHETKRSLTCKEKELSKSIKNTLLRLDLFNIQYKKICSWYLKFYFMRISMDVIVLHLARCSLGAHLHTKLLWQYFCRCVFLESVFSGVQLPAPPFLYFTCWESNFSCHQCPQVPSQPGSIGFVWLSPFKAWPVPQGGFVGDKESRKGAPPVWVCNWLWCTEQIKGKTHSFYRGRMQTGAVIRSGVGGFLPKLWTGQCPKGEPKPKTNKQEKKNALTQQINSSILSSQGLPTWYKSNAASTS